MFSRPAQVRGATELTGQLRKLALPVGGINARDAYESMAPNDAVSMTNMRATAYGIEVRHGFQEWATKLPGENPVGTLMSYYSSLISGVSSSGLGMYASPLAQEARQLPFAVNTDAITVRGQLFACTSKQIYDVSAGGSGPWVAQTGVGTVTSDYWTWRNFQNAAGNFLIAANHGGGYVVYGGAGFSNGFSDGFRTATSGFTRIGEGESYGQISGVDPDLFCYVMAWKQRLWFVEKDSSRAWYLPPQQLTGQAFQFDFGPMFRHGGHLVALVNWTIDGGEGLDDYLVAFGSEGDVVIYKGYDPDNADVDPAAFQLHGIWYIGPLPAGRRQIDPYGGDVYVLSALGLSQVSKLVLMSQLEPEAVRNLSEKIDPLLVALIKRTMDSEDWFIKMLPREEAYVIGSPEVLAGQGTQQFVYHQAAPGWSIYRDLPIACYCTHDSLIFGGSVKTGVGLGGIVYLMFDNELDNVPLEPDEENAGKAIACALVPAYQSLGAPGMFKNFPMVRPMLISDAVPDYSVSVLTDFEFPAFRSTIPLPPIGTSLWDQARWDQNKWTGSPRPIRKWVGTVGGGYVGTCQIDLTAIGGTKITSIDMWVQDGGPL